MTGFFLPVPAVSGGATEKIWHRLATAFAAEGHTVTMLSRRWPGLEDDERDQGVHHRRLKGFNHTRSLPLNLVLDFLWGTKVARALPVADAVICNTITLPVWLKRFRPAAGKVVVHIGRIPKGQVRFYGQVDRVFVPSAFVARQIPSGSVSDRTRIIGYPIEWSSLANSSTRNPNEVTLGFVGRLHPEKGVELLINAACRLARRTDLPSWRLKLLGPRSVAQGGGGEAWVSRLRLQTEQALGDRIEWLEPEFDPAKLARVYGSLDVFCYPSLATKGETFGVAVAEAMAARCAVVVSALECFSDLVADGETGLVFDHGAPDAEVRLAECLGRLIAEPNLRTSLATRGQEHARRFDFPEISRQILEDLALLAGKNDENRQPSGHA